MYRIGLSTPSAITEEMFKGYSEADIRHMEVSVGKEHCDAMDFSLLKSWSDKYRVKLYSFHLPFWPFNELDISSKELCSKTVEYFAEFIKKGSEIGIDKYIIHSSGEPINEGDREERMACAKKSLDTLAKIAKEYGSVICVENLPRTCLGRDSNDMLELLSANGDLRACFDTNHLLSESAADFVKSLGDKIVTAHISDYDFKNERHWLPGEGDTNWREMLELFKSINYEGAWLYEINLEAPYTISRPRDLCYGDFVKNALELFEGKDTTIIGKRKNDLKFWNE